MLVRTVGGYPRAWNQAFFTKLYIASDVDGNPAVAAAELSEPFGQLLSKDLAKDAKAVANANPAAFAAGGPNVDHVVDSAALELRHVRLSAAICMAFAHWAGS
jgi:hypothetical protein